MRFMTSPAAPGDGGAQGAAPGAGRQVAVGDMLGPVTFHLDRAQLVRYAGASGDFNPIHWNARIATEVGLPDVIAHGMLTMALVGRLVTDWIGDPAAVLDFEVRFTRPVVVADPDGADLTVSGTVAEVTRPDDGPHDGPATARIDLTATVDGRKVLGKARAVVRLAATA